MVCFDDKIYNPVTKNCIQNTSQNRSRIAGYKQNVLQSKASIKVILTEEQKKAVDWIEKASTITQEFVGIQSVEELKEAWAKCQVPDSYLKLTFDQRTAFKNAMKTSQGRNAVFPLQLYTGPGGYKWINIMSNIASDEIPANSTQFLYRLDHAFDEFGTKPPRIHLYRGAVIPLGNEYNLQQGSNYVSTTFCKQVAVSFACGYKKGKMDKSVIVHIDASSVKCLSLSSLSEYADEAEVILPRTVRFTFISKSQSKLLYKGIEHDIENIFVKAT